MQEAGLGQVGMYRVGWSDRNRWPKLLYAARENVVLSYLRVRKFHESPSANGPIFVQPLSEHLV